MKYTLLFIITLLSLHSFGQESTSTTKGNILGSVHDSKDSTAVAFASVKLLNPIDSSFVTGVSTSEEGDFQLNPQLGKYILEISFLGYRQEKLDIELTSKKNSIQLNKIYLDSDDILLGEAEIIGEIPPMVVKGDTIEFNAGSYNVDGSNVLKDLIKQIPGLEMDENGSLKANGKAITKILVDGKEYFGNDISMALTTLPANMITKLQLFEKESEEAKATGIKDEDPEQVLNLEVKEEFKKSVFGDTKSGIGNKSRHTNRLNLNKMHGDNQYALVGDLNNINDSEYKYNNNFDDNIDKSIGTNFNIQESEKISFNGSAKYNNYKSRDEYISDSYSSVINQYSDRNGNSINRRQNMNGNVTMDWKPDSLTTIYLRTSLGYSDGENTSTSMDSVRMVGKSTTSTRTSRLSNNDGFNTNNSLFLSRRLNNDGRNISLTLNQSYNKDDSEGTNYSVKKYWEESTTDTIDHVSKNNSESISYGLSARYVEPIGKDNRVHISYSANSSNSDRTGDVRKTNPATGEYDIVDPDYSRSTESYSMRQNIRMGFQRTKEKYNFNLSLSLDPSYTKNSTFFVNAPPEILKQNVVNYSPSIHYTWKRDKNTHLNFNYYGSTRHPNISQLSSDVVILSATSKSVGNPDLRPSFNNRFGVDFRKSDFESGRYLSANMSYSYTFNNTVSYQLIDDHSNTMSTYRNVDGNSNAYAYVTFNTPLRNKKINVGSSFNVFFNRNISFINEQKSIQDRISISPNVYGRYNSEKIEANINFFVSHSIGNNNLSEIQTSNTTDYRLSNSFKLKLPLHFAVESALEFTYKSGLGEGIRKDETMWNLAASKLFLRDNRGMLKFEVFDVLNNLRSQENTVSGSDYSNYWKRVINNYFILSFSYRFNISQK